MLQKPRIICFYIGYKTCIKALKILPLYKKTTIGGINFYGSEQIVGQFEKAVREEFPKYDPKLNQRLLNKNFELDIFYQDNFSYFIPEAGTFFAPKWIFDYNSEGIFQYVVYCILGSQHTGVGLCAATRILDREKMLSECKTLMRSWIMERKFPERWLSSYQVP